MNIVIAPDSLKESLSAIKVADVIEAGFREILQHAGYVKMPNVNMLVEMADMREANRSYDANLQTIKQARDLISSTIDLLKSS